MAALPEHPNIVRYYRAWQQHRMFYLQMALCENGSLASLLRAAGRRGQTVPEALCWRALWEVAQGLDFLHAHGVLHLDIKLDNIFLDAAGTFQIGDFGLAVLRQEWVRLPLFATKSHEFMCISLA